MEHYQGLKPGDAISGGGSFVSEHGMGFEVCNFYPVNGHYYGYVQPATPGRFIDIERIGAAPGDHSISDVTIVWTATRPSGGRVIIGWYTSATVYAQLQAFDQVSTIQGSNNLEGFWIKAPAEKSKLLPLDARIFSIPRGKGFMGQSNIWYADSPEAASFIKSVQKYLQSGASASNTVRRHGVTIDQEKKVRVELAAVKLCCNYFEGLGYAIDDVSENNLGWDLEAKHDKATLRIEVKGLSGNVFSVELTPNEYLAFKERASNYRLAVVLNALDKPKLFLCRFSGESNNWIIEGEHNLSIEVATRESATIFCHIL